MNSNFYTEIKSVFACIKFYCTSKVCERDKYESIKKAIQPLYAELINTPEVNNHKILIYCIDTLFEIIDEGDYEKIFEFACVIHNMPEICTGARPLETFKGEIEYFRKKYGEQYFPFFRTSTLMDGIHEFAEYYLSLYSDPKTSNRQVENGFAEKCFSLGFEVDGGRSFCAKYERAANDAEEFSKIIEEIVDVQFLGTAIFSKWRFITHWTESDLLADGKREWFIIAFERLAAITSSS